MTLDLVKSTMPYNEDKIHLDDIDSHNIMINIINSMYNDILANIDNKNHKNLSSKLKNTQIINIQIKNLTSLLKLYEQLNTKDKNSLSYEELITMGDSK